MCGECNGSENVEPSEDLNTVNVHDGTWRELIPRVDTIRLGDCWEDTGEIITSDDDCGQLFVPGCWRRIPEHERTPQQTQTERVPYADDGTWRRLNVGETMIAFDWWEYPEGRFNPCDEREGRTLTNENSIVWRKDPNAKPLETTVVPPVVSEGEDNRPEEQRNLDSILAGIVTRVWNGTKYEAAIEVMQRLYPHGYGIDEQGAMFSLGFTGKRKAITIPALRECFGFNCNSEAFATILQRLGGIHPPKFKTAHGDGIHAVFEGYRPGSCMAGSCCRDMREIYACNPDSVGIIYSVRSNDNPLIESTFSALFWIGNKRVYLDRMYSSGSYSHTVQYDWLCDYLEAVHGKPCVPIYNRSQKRPQWEEAITFKLKDSGNPLPYIDSLYVVKKYDGRNVWLTTKETASDIHCRDTAGTYPDGRDRYQCCECGCRMDEDDSRSDENGNTYCESCWNDNFAYCNWYENDYPVNEVSEQEVYSYGSRYRQRYHSGRDYNLMWTTITISDTALSDCFTELHDGRYAANGFTVEDNRGRVFATDPDSWDDAVLTEDGELYHTDDVVTLSDGRVYPVDECTEVDGEWYLSGEEPEQEDDSTEDSEDEQPAQKAMVTE